MDQETRNKLQRTTQQVRRILEEEFAEQLEGTFDILPDGKILLEPGKHLDARQRLTRQKLVDAIEHIKAGGKKPREAVNEYTRETAFTFLNRFVALRMLEARGLLQECVSKGDQSSGFKEFCGLAPGLSSLPDDGYRLYLECLCDELSVEVKVLFDRRDSASLLWPRRGALTELLDTLGQSDLAGVWSEDETIGWVYQYFNSGEERKKMREESQAPRNSRELAVRNQFFTPRYVVEFLTDNTLGRIWYEMRQGQTRLVHECRYLVRRPNEVFLNEGQEPPADDTGTEQDLSQEELLKKTAYIPYRGKKDPRDLKILDPACGSGHFLLYAFDLLIAIYEEAWRDETSPPALEAKGPDGESPAKPLQEDYPELQQLHAALPGLVLADNLHGIDIDPRAAQIAALALWMRGQRVFNEFQIPREQRLAIARSNINCAEPMPGEAAFLDEFVAEHLSDGAEGRFLASLVRKVFEAMKLAGEAGSLLKIEEDIADEVAKAKKQWLERPEFKQKTLFADGPTIAQKELALTHDITDESFWEEAEQRIYDALRGFSEQAERSGGFQRRLFAADAARGFAFIDLCRKRYDVAVMNPPFGEFIPRTDSFASSCYANSYQDFYAAFVERALHLTCHGGFVGVISSEAGFFRRTLEKWRRNVLLAESSLHLMAHLGGHVLDGATVRTAAYVMSSISTRVEAMFLRLLGKHGKQPRLLEAIQDLGLGQYPDCVFCAAQAEFEKLPFGVFGYWCSAAIRNAFVRLPTLDPTACSVKVGLQTGDDFRFLRLRWEIVDAPEGLEWAPFAKGGEYSPFYDDIHLMVRWNGDGTDLRAASGSVLRNPGDYFKHGITYTPRTNKRFAPRILPAGCCFSNKGPAIVDVKADTFALLAYLNSRVVSYLLGLGIGAAETEGGSGANSYEVGLVKELPIPPEATSNSDLSRLGEAAWKLRKAADSGNETAVAFVSPACGMKHKTFGETVAAIADFREQNAENLGALQREIDTITVGLLKLRPEDWQIISADVSEFEAESALNEQEIQTELIYSMLSYHVGCLLGRWRTAPLASGAKGGSSDFTPLAFAPDDPGHPFDLASRVEGALSQSFPDIRAHLEDRQFAGSGLRSWIRREFFDNHKKQYSKSKRKAPVYWQLATPSASYSVWLYYHRFSRDTFFKVLNEYVKPKLDHERQKLDRLRGEAGAEPTRSQRKEIEDQEKFLAELASMVEDVERIAPLWNPNLNDGVIINFAPLWRLVPQNKSWQKECKKVWDKLVAGDYDWAHLAMHLWPERVVPKCVTDASLAISHGLEETFWTQDEKDRFQPLEEPTGGWQPVIDELVAERSSPAVKAALGSLLNAPARTASSSRKRARSRG